MVIRRVCFGLLGLLCVFSGRVCAQDIEEQQQIQIEVQELNGPFRVLIRKLVLRCSVCDVYGVLYHLSDVELGELRDLLMQERELLGHGLSMTGLVGRSSGFARGLMTVVKGIAGLCLGGFVVVYAGLAGALIDLSPVGEFVAWNASLACIPAGATAGVVHEYYAEEGRISQRCKRLIKRIDYILECLGQ
jgi:hypothetical protein